MWGIDMNGSFVGVVGGDGDFVKEIFGFGFLVENSY